MATIPATLSQMLQRPNVIGVFSRIKPAGLGFSTFYGMRTNNVATEPANINRNVVYDVFNNRRTAASVRVPLVGPARKSPNPVGQAQATAIRLYESMPYLYEKVQSIRPIGGQYAGRLDQRGKTWVALQMRAQAQRMENAIEFMVSRMFRGGFGVNVSGEDWYLCEKGAGKFDVSYAIPSTNTGSCGGIIDASWAVTTTTKIANQFLDLGKQAEALCGWPLKHAWINSSTFKLMIANTQLNNVRGIAYRIFDNFVPTQIATTNGERESGFTVEFLAIPGILFHVYNAVSIVASDSETAATSLYIPDNKMILTPEPAAAEWHGMYHAAEFVRKGGDHMPASLVTGFDSWTNPTNHPPGEELTMIHNLVPLLYVPSATYYVDVTASDA